MIPDIAYIKVLDTLLTVLRDDAKTNFNNRGKSLLNLLFDEVDDTVFERVDFLNEAFEIFSRTEKDPNYITIDLTYNTQQNRSPTLFLSLGGEQYDRNAIGNDQEDYIDDEDGVSYHKINVRRWSQSQSLYIYSENSNEVLIVYFILKSALISCLDFLAVTGFQNITLSGQDIAQYPDFIPKAMFYRVLTCNFQYEMRVPEIFKNQLLRSLIVTGEIKLPDNE